MLRTLYPKSGDKTHCSNSVITLMWRMLKDPTKRLDVAHYLWHEIRMASLQLRRRYPHAPYIMALIDSKVPSPLEITQSHPMWAIPEHMYFNAPEVQMSCPIPVQSIAGGALRHQASE